MFTKEKLIDDVAQKDFTVEVAGEQVPCVVWSPADARGPRNLIVMGHGGSQHAAESRIRCAVFGLAGLRSGTAFLEAAAAAISIPVQFVFQWDDALVPCEAGIALFNAFGSTEKTMHINPGGHMGMPSFEAEAWRSFFARHLGAAV